jgi:hypothetical protein
LWELTHNVKGGNVETPHVVIEQIIMLPVLIALVLLLPFFANSMTLSWIDARRQVLLQDAASQLGSTIQQLYFALDSDEVAAGTISQSPNLPQTIESYTYTATGYLAIPTFDNESRTLILTLTLHPLGKTAKSNVVLGPNVLWNDSVFVSNSTYACVCVQKFENGTLLFFFRGD